MMAILIIVLNSAKYFSNLCILVVMLFVKPYPFTISSFNNILILTTLEKQGFEAGYFDLENTHITS